MAEIFVKTAMSMYTSRWAASVSAVSGAAMLAALAATPAAAQDADCSFFEGKTVELVVPFNPGGGFDAYGRLVAKYMGDELGAKNMIVRNQPGAGGLLATNQTWTAKPDGLLVQLMSTSGMLTAELGQADGVHFKSGEFSWIGRVSGEPDALAVGPQSEIKTIDDINKLSSQRQVRIGSSGVGDIDYVEAQLLTKIFDLDSNIVTGFSGAPEVYASLARGELDLFTSSLSAALQAERADSAKAMWLFSSEADPSAPDLKPLSDFVDAEALPLLKAHSDLIMAGRALAGPPGIPADRLECLRDAFDRTLKDPALLEESVQLKRPVAPIDGETLGAMISGLTSNAPQAYVDLVRSTYSN